MFIIQEKPKAGNDTVLLGETEMNLYYSLLIDFVNVTYELLGKLLYDYWSVIVGLGLCQGHCGIVCCLAINHSNFLHARSWRVANTHLHLAKKQNQKLSLKSTLDEINLLTTINSTVQIILTQFYRTHMKFINFLRNKDITHFENLVIYIGVKAFYKLRNLTQKCGRSQYLTFYNMEEVWCPFLQVYNRM